jgi:hypothetical protein
MAAMAAKTMAAGKNESTAVQKNGLAVNSHFSVVQVRQTPSAQNQIQIVDTHETSETLAVTRLQRVGYQINRTLLD